MELVGVGHNVDDGPYWIMKNSWGKKYGTGGYFYMKKGSNACDFESRSVQYANPSPYNVTGESTESTEPSEEEVMVAEGIVARQDDDATGCKFKYIKLLSSEKLAVAGMRYAMKISAYSRCGENQNAEEEEISAVAFFSHELRTRINQARGTTKGTKTVPVSRGRLRSMIRDGIEISRLVRAIMAKLEPPTRKPTAPETTQAESTTVSATTASATTTQDPSCAAVGLTNGSGCRQCTGTEVMGMMNKLPDACQQKFRAAMKAFPTTGKHMPMSEACSCYLQHPAPETLVQCYFAPGAYPLKFAYNYCYSRAAADETTTMAAPQPTTLAATIGTTSATPSTPSGLACNTKRTDLLWGTVLHPGTFEQCAEHAMQLNNLVASCGRKSALRRNNGFSCMASTSNPSESILGSVASAKDCKGLARFLTKALKKIQRKPAVKFIFEAYGDAGAGFQRVYIKSKRNCANHVAR